MNEFENTPVVTPRQLGEKILFGELEKRVEELEAKVESLTRTLDLWQELTGIEIVARPMVKTHMGTCEQCDRLAPLNDANICEGCFYEEIAG